jgi:hypothetical protein
MKNKIYKTIYKYNGPMLNEGTGVYDYIVSNELKKKKHKKSINNI